MKKVCIFGAGKKGSDLYDIIRPWNRVAYFVDNDRNKQGKKYRGIKIIPFEKFLDHKKEYDLIVSFYSCEVYEQLENEDVDYWTWGGEKNYFGREDVIEKKDDYIYDQFMFNRKELQSIFKDYTGNWFRKEFLSDRNEYIVKNMEAGEAYELDEVYQDDIIYPDEYFENRPCMRLIYNIITKNYMDGQALCDLGCGHGMFVLRLKSSHLNYNISALDGSFCRVKYLLDHGINAVQGNVMHTNFQSDSFDLITCMEVLEHVEDVDKTIKEIYRVLKKGGHIWIAVPDGKRCDCDTHVRQFTVNRLASAFLENHFEIENILKVPCNNDEMVGHILLQAKK